MTQIYTERYIGSADSDGYLSNINLITSPTKANASTVANNLKSLIDNQLTIEPSLVDGKYGGNFRLNHPIEIVTKDTIKFTTPIKFVEQSAPVTRGYNKLYYNYENVENSDSTSIYYGLTIFNSTDPYIAIDCNLYETNLYSNVSLMMIPEFYNPGWKKVNITIISPAYINGRLVSSKHSYRSNILLGQKYFKYDFIILEKKEMLDVGNGEMVEHTFYIASPICGYRNSSDLTGAGAFNPWPILYTLP